MSFLRQREWQRRDTTHIPGSKNHANKQGTISPAHTPSPDTYSTRNVKHRLFFSKSHVRAMLTFLRRPAARAAEGRSAGKRGKSREACVEKKGGTSSEGEDVRGLLLRSSVEDARPGGKVQLYCSTQPRLVTDTSHARQFRVRKPC